MFIYVVIYVLCETNFVHCETMFCDNFTSRLTYVAT